MYVWIVYFSYHQWSLILEPTFCLQSDLKQKNPDFKIDFSD